MGAAEVSLFIGCLPGNENRQIILFPGGCVLADMREQEIETPTGDYLQDRGWTAATLLIQKLNAYGWYIDELDNATASVWLKPRAGSEALSDIKIRGVRIGSAAEAPEAECQP